MGVTRLIEHGVSESAAQVMDLVLSHITLARELTIARAGKGQPRLDRLQIRVNEGEDARKVSKETAELAIEIAEADVGRKAKRYVFALWGEALPGRQPGRLDELTITIRPEEDDDEDTSAAKAAQRIMSDMGDRHIQLLDQQLNMLGKLMPMHAQADELGAATVTAQGATQVKLTELAIARAERREMIELGVMVMPFLKPFGDAAADYIRAQAEATRTRAREGSKQPSAPEATASATPPPANEATPAAPKPRPGQVVAATREAWGFRLTPEGVVEIVDEATALAFCLQTMSSLGPVADDGLVVLGSVLAAALGLDWNPLLARIGGGSVRDASRRYEAARAAGQPAEAQIRSAMALG